MADGYLGRLFPHQTKFDCGTSSVMTHYVRHSNPLGMHSIHNCRIHDTIQIANIVILFEIYKFLYKVFTISDLGNKKGELK